MSEKRKRVKEDEAVVPPEEPAESPKKKPKEEEGSAKTSPKKPKAKAKTKAKVKAQAKGKLQKKPAANEETKPQETKPQKGGKVTVADKIQKWKEFDAEENEGTKEAHDEEEPSEEEEHLRDTGKARKFKKLKDAKAIPEHILEMVNRAASRKEKTDLINGLFQRDKHGHLVMVASRPQFESGKTAAHKKFGTEEAIGKPWEVFLHSDFGGNLGALNQAVQSGAVQTWTDGGLKYAGYKQTRAGVEKSSTDQHSLTSGPTDLNDEQHALLKKAFTTMAWKFGEEEPVPSVAGEGMGVSKAKPIENVGMTPKMKELLLDAKEAQDRLYGTSMKLLSKCSSVEDKQSFKGVVMQLKEMMTKNEHILTFEELPDDVALTPTNFHTYLKGIADLTQRLNEKVEQFRALLKTRKEL